MTKSHTTWSCETCGSRFDTQQEAVACEARPVREDKGVQVGDVVRITKGDGAGERGRVQSLGALPPEWGQDYVHTVALYAECIDSWGMRRLSFDSYETIAKEEPPHAT